MVKAYKFYILFILISFHLVGCAPIAVVSAPSSYADKRTTEAQFNDQKIEIQSILNTQDIYSGSNVSFVSYNQTVLITGEVRSEETKDLVDQTVLITGEVRSEETKDLVGEQIQKMPNVKGVKNFLLVTPENSSLKSEANDTLITANIKSRLFIQENETQLFPLHVKVVTERQVVYLMGILSEKDVASAIKIAKSSRGVKKVVPLFEMVE